MAYGDFLTSLMAPLVVDGPLFLAPRKLSTIFEGGTGEGVPLVVRQASASSLDDDSSSDDECEVSHQEPCWAPKMGRRQLRHAREID
mmetsp:Transcript_18563/g.46503  ORF Transcript_18563/g.46503 Transcript_18563/m.46503 type:complete len:87 (-) Transcript_18563:585-845(-)